MFEKEKEKAIMKMRGFERCDYMSVNLGMATGEAIAYEDAQKKVEEAKEQIKSIREKSLEDSGIDLTGFSQDDVWERAIQYAKEKILGEVLK